MENQRPILIRHQQGDANLKTDKQATSRSIKTFQGQVKAVQEAKTGAEDQASGLQIYLGRMNLRLLETQYLAVASGFCIGHPSNIWDGDRGVQFSMQPIAFSGSPINCCTDIPDVASLMTTDLQKPDGIPLRKLPTFADATGAK